MTLSVSTLKFIILFVIIIAVAIIATLAPIPQDLAYHQFVDQRRWLSIPNYWNVLTNLGFIWVGLFGLYQLFTQQLKVVGTLTINYAMFFIGVGLVAFGSGYYHWQPNNRTLIWDRLPMTIAFMSLLSVAFGEFLSVSLGRKSLWPLVFIGITSVCYWYWGELYGIGDLRLYVLIQFLPMLILPILFFFGKSVFKSNWGYWLLLSAYIFAKLVEHFDIAIFSLTNSLFAGHAIKHILVVMGLYFLILYFKKRNTEIKI
jgi:hypothetical protein